MDLKKKGVYIVIILGAVFFSCFVFATTKDNPGHTGDEVFISINGKIMSLQEAINNNFLKDGAVAPTTGGTTSVTEGYHNGNIIYVNLEGQHTIQEAIDGGISFCRDQTGFSNWVFSFGHSGENIKVNYNGQERNFQELVDSTEFCSYEWSYSDWSPCSSCGGTQTRTILGCRRSDGVNVGNVLCGEAVTSQTCNYFWYTGSWSSCSEPACGSGTQSRSIYCKQCDGGQVGDNKCNSALRPSAVQLCFSGSGTCGWGTVNPISSGCTTSCGRGDKYYYYGCIVPGKCSCYGMPDYGGCSSGSWWYRRTTELCEAGKPKCGWEDVYGLPGSKLDKIRCASSTGCFLNGVYYTQGIQIQLGTTKVLCTEAYNQGYLSKEFYEADVEYAEKYFDEEILLGYHSWAKPLVRVLRKNSEVADKVIPLSVEWAKHMAFVMGKSEEESLIGKVLLENGAVYCGELGQLLVKEGYSLDNEYEFDDAFVEEIFLKNIGIFSEESLMEDKEEIQRDFENFIQEIINYYMLNRKLNDFNNFNYDFSLTKYL